MSLMVMLPFVGLVPPGTGLIKTNGFERALAAGVFPPGPVMSHEDWDLLHAYYLHRAPEALPAPKEPVLAGNQTQFETVIPKAPFDANCIAVRMHPDGGLLASHDVTKKCTA